MEQTIKLSERLTIVASFLSEGTFLADIGSDHAFLPCSVCLKDKQARAIAGEVNEGPYKSALKTVTANKLTDVIDVRLGDGLDVLDKDKVTELVLAGMGASLITEILEKGKQKLRTVERIITQPNIGSQNVRKWLYHNDFMLTHEVLLEENTHMYEILVADKGQSTYPYKEEIIEKQFLFGPYLLRGKTELFYKKWENEHKKRCRVLEQMKQGNIQNEQKMLHFEKELMWIKEVLESDENYL